MCTHTEGCDKKHEKKIKRYEKTRMILHINAANKMLTHDVRSWLSKNQKFIKMF